MAVLGTLSRCVPARLARRLSPAPCKSPMPRIKRRF